VVIFCDNASIHKGEKLMGGDTSGAPYPKVLYNLPYRPELNGIELWWGAAKRKYRKAIL
jgi:transposase